MATINPLIDTLLHDVLGKRMEVKPGSAGAPVSSFTSGEPDKYQKEFGANQQGLNTEQSSKSRQLGKGLEQSGYSDRSIPDHGATISPLAKLLNYALSRIESPAILRALVVLMKEGHVNPEVLAQRLEESLKYSGLFYERELVKWLKGELTAEQLQRHPQYQQQFSNGFAASSVSDEVLDEFARLPTGLSHPDVTKELRTVVAHQLEILLNPIIRWEGYVYPNFFTTLWIQLVYPEGRKEKDAEPNEVSATEIRVKLGVTYPNGITVNVDIKIQELNCWAIFSSEHRAMMSNMSKYSNHLESSLRAAGFKGLSIKFVVEGANV